MLQVKLDLLLIVDIIVESVRVTPSKIGTMSSRILDNDLCSIKESGRQVPTLTYWCPNLARDENYVWPHRSAPNTGHRDSGQTE